MAENDWKKRLGVVFSTNPDFTYEEEAVQEEQTLEPGKQNLIVSIDRKGRGGKKDTQGKVRSGRKCQGWRNHNPGRLPRQGRDPSQGYGI